MMFFIILISAFCHATTEVIRAPDADKAGFQSFLYKNSGYSRLAKATGDDGSSVLIDEFAQAKGQYLKKQYPRAKALLISIADNRWSSDWEKADREIIFQSLLLLAEMSGNEREQNLWVTNAVHFVGQENFDRSYFSKNTNSKYEQIIKNQKIISWTPAADFSAWDKVKINGRQFNLGRETNILLFATTYRVTLISDSAPELTRLIHADSLREFVPANRSILAGTCEFPKINEFDWNKKSFIAYYNRDCQWLHEGGSWKPLSQSNENKLWQPTPLLHTNTANLTESRWPWKTIGLIAVGVAIVWMNQSQGEIHHPLKEVEDSPK